jgi:hypothetical protein
MRSEVVPRHYVENERRYGLRVYIKNFSMSADVGKEKSLVMLNNSRRRKHLSKALAVWKPS